MAAAHRQMRLADTCHIRHAKALILDQAIAVSLTGETPAGGSLNMAA
jgi:hypothetical protein